MFVFSTKKATIIQNVKRKLRGVKMSEPKSFEETFDHDPDTAYEAEEEQDLGRDTEFEGQPLPASAKEKTKERTSYKINRKRKRRADNGGIDDDAPSSGGCLKYVLFVLGITALYLYTRDPKEVKEAALQTVQKIAISQSKGSKVMPVISPANQVQKKGTEPPDWLKVFLETDEQESNQSIEKEKIVSGKMRELTKDLKAGEKVLRPTFSPLPETGIKTPSVLLDLPEKPTGLPNSKARGSLPSLETAMQKNDALKQTVERISQMTLNETDIFRSAVKNMIYQWADVDGLPDSDKDFSERKTAVVNIIRTTPPKMIKVYDGAQIVEVIDESVPLPEPPPALSDEGVAEQWRKLTEEIVYELLAQSVLKNAGIMTHYFERSGKISFETSTLQVMADMYPLLEKLLASKPKMKDKMKMIEPVSSFLLRACGSDMECLASYDLLMESLGFSAQELKVLQDAPLSVYNP